VTLCTIELVTSNTLAITPNILLDWHRIVILQEAQTSINHVP
jgi:hypothetical protein